MNKEAIIDRHSYSYMNGFVVILDQQEEVIDRHAADFKVGFNNAEDRFMLTLSDDVTFDEISRPACKWGFALISGEIVAKVDMGYTIGIGDAVDIRAQPQPNRTKTKRDTVTRVCDTHSSDA